MKLKLANAQTKLEFGTAAVESGTAERETVVKLLVL